jgi:hypothetical protein
LPFSNEGNMTHNTGTTTPLTELRGLTELAAPEQSIIPLPDAAALRRELSAVVNGLTVEDLALLVRIAHE